MSLFSAEERQSIQQAVTDAEAHTAGELVVAHAARSHDYAFPRFVLAILLALALIDVGHHFFPDLPMSYLLMAEAGIIALLYGVLGLGPILRGLIPARMRQEYASRAALRAFVECGVTETRDRSGVLIYISELERQVTILADHGINERVDAKEWQTDVDGLVAAIRQGEAHSGVLQSIDRIGKLLAEAFPPRADRKNELPNAVVRLDSP